MRGLTFEVRRDRRQDARPGPVKMYRVPPARAWWPAVGAPLERGVRPCTVLRWMAAAQSMLVYEEADKLGPCTEKKRPACMSLKASRSWPLRHAAKGGALRKEIVGCPRSRWRLCNADGKPRKHLSRAARAAESQRTVMGL